MSAPTILRGILDQTRTKLAEREREQPLQELREQATAAASAPGRFHAALSEPGMAVIAEFKRRSPSAGRLREDASLEWTVCAYEQGGASAASILTEEDNFDGSLEDLRAARQACTLPLLRKDFLVDPYQLYEAVLAGADAVLLIVAALEDERLATLHDEARALGLDVLVEVHDAEELARAAGIGARLIGINNRDLRDFSLDVERTYRLLDAMPSEATIVSESGISDAEQLIRLEQAGVAAVLVGETLMRAGDPAHTLGELLGRRASGSEH